jgi:hypothetical protein
LNSRQTYKSLSWDEVAGQGRHGAQRFCPGLREY